MGACLVSGDDVIKGFKDAVERLHAKKLKVIGATVVSSFGSPIESYGFPKFDTEHKKVNDFIRAGGLFDGGEYCVLFIADGFTGLPGDDQPFIVLYRGRKP